MQVRDKKVGTGCAPYIVAEMACAHQGKPELAEKIITHAAVAQADAIQFQIFSSDHLISCRHSAFGQAKDLEISRNDWALLIRKAKETDLALWINVFDSASADFAAEQGADALKIHSTDLSNPYMLDVVAAAKLPVSLAVGGSLKEEIDYAVDYLKNKGVENLILMHGYQGFPTPTHDNNLAFIRTLKETYDLPVGFQDHAAGTSAAAFWLPIMSLAAGANLIEKHITYDAGLSDIDHQSSLSPNDFQEFIAQVRDAATAIGIAEFRNLSEGEITYRNRMKKVIVAATNLPEGHTISLSDIHFLRSETIGLQAKEAGKLIGKKTMQAYKKGEVINA